MYYGGHGTEKDEELALKYFQLAAQQGHADAQENFRLLKEAIDAENEIIFRRENG
jgi:TPR repeat protein